MASQNKGCIYCGNKRARTIVAGGVACKKCIPQAAAGDISRPLLQLRSYGSVDARITDIGQLVEDVDGIYIRTRVGLFFRILRKSKGRWLLVRKSTMEAKCIVGKVALIKISR